MIKIPGFLEKGLNMRVCSLLVTVWITSQAAAALAEGGTYTFITITCKLRSYREPAADLWSKQWEHGLSRGLQTQMSFKKKKKKNKVVHKMVSSSKADKTSKTFDLKRKNSGKSRSC
ncbi:hypothetical protein AMECASPLE_001795 [Ameca splendens]|uniref:Uncharacterized protein n=1 Tax=Ameca splendens TaxID=208324 RepID=A0ABV0ZIC4_9TELE